MIKFALELQKSCSKISKTPNHEDYANDTELLKKYWEVKQNNFYS